MSTPETGTLAVAGARLHFEVRGAGPLLLLIPGGNSDAAVFDPMAAALAEDHRVLTYDPRGNSRSPLDGPPVDQRLDVHTDDAYRLLGHVAAAGESVQVFGSCSGGLVALELAVRHPDRIRSAVVHEPPALAVLPDAAALSVFIDDVHETFRRAGVAAAMRKLNALFGGRPAPVLPQAHDNTAFFLAHTMRPFTRVVPDFAAVAAAAGRIAVAGGRASSTQVICRPAAVLAERIGRELTEFPGGHIGYATWPVEFAERLVGVFAAMPAPGGVPEPAEARET
ncbi:alpha/beta fold hydrolase [Streptomyces syringium]|uniref:Pimeloyl-ACP methyl ester carboxylesterase n=1 Tax=Streptomyces syringium TaxID=76729 RepID=A0ABS4XXH0_9ACTN|nr:alpha/beta fold hydrolase [Streptomyces syringium]MBP2401197.1 pimeloyl-ACP methyl ester carboxylesterase [Streptomyces syringium]